MIEKMKELEAAIDGLFNPKDIKHDPAYQCLPVMLNPLAWQEFQEAAAARTFVPEAIRVMEEMAEALRKTPVYATKDGVWINSRVKGSAMWGLQNAEPEIQESFAESGRLINEALAAYEKFKAGVE